jgi:RNA polymerase sigma-70 factor (ECF subfamily)
MTRGDESQPEGSVDWIGRAYDCHGAGLYRYALMLLMDPAAAADVVQQVFLALVRRPPALDNDVHYLRRAVRNEAYSLLRRRRRRPEGTADVHMLEAIPATDDRPDDRLALEQALKTLPADQREVVHLKAFEGMTFQEIADATGESINTVTSRYRYALHKMRGTLGARS